MRRAARLRRGIYLLPTAFTVANLFCGFFSLVCTFRGETAMAAVLIITAGILDALDGRIARFTNSASSFGREFDSLADIVSFGVAPALLIYRWALQPLGRLGWLVTFLFVVCAAMRLARFNIQTVSADKRFFTGLPSPSAGGALACLVFAFPAAPGARGWSVALAVLVATLGSLMISRFRYPSFKPLALRSRHSYLYVLPLAGLLVAVAVEPASAMLVLAAAYLLSAPAVHLWGAMRASRRRRERDARREVADEPVLR